MTTENLGLPELIHRERNGEVTHNEALRKLDVFSQPRVEAILTAQPGSPSEGQYWIVAPGATGSDWSGQDNKIAHFYNSVWHFYDPQIFYRFRNRADGVFYVWDGLSWLPDGSHGMFLGGPVDSFTLNATDSKLVNFTDYGQWGWLDQNDLNPVAGELTIPVNGFFRVNIHIIGQRTDTVKEVDVVLKIDTVGGTTPGRIEIGFAHVATDKGALLTQLSANFSRLYEKDQVLSLYMWANESLGSFTVLRSTFEVDYVAQTSNITETSW